jgi:DNA-binding NtrC family response regulator
MGSPKILVVDDDMQVRRTVVRFLEPSYDVMSVPGGNEALEVLRLGHRPDLVVSDVDMPMVDGPSLFRSCMEELLLPKDSFVFMSGSQTGERISFLLKERLTILAKPFGMEAFLDIIEAHLSERVLTRLRKVVKITA